VRRLFSSIIESFTHSNGPEYLLLIGILILRLRHLTLMPLFFDEIFHVEEIRRLIMYGEYFHGITGATHRSAAASSIPRKACN